MRWRTCSAVLVLVMAASAPGALEAATTSGVGGSRLWHDGAVVPLKDAVDVPIPSFSRQTKLPCTACHTTFPQLTQFGRLFKLNGYTLAGIEQVRATLPDTSAAPVLALDLIPPVSVMDMTSATALKGGQPGTQNPDVEFPEQLSIFVGEAITPRLGTFLQFTYSSVDGSFGMDNADIRLANQASVGNGPVIYGLTLNNNPTVQDVFNTVPAWGFPYVSSSTAPAPLGAPVLFDDMGGRVAGLGAYTYFHNLIYAELSGYRSAPQGGPHPADSTATTTIAGVAPYWRLALTHQFGPSSLEVGTYGISVNQFPEGVSGAKDRYTDFALDGQYQWLHPRTQVTAHATWLRESQRWDASYPAGLTSNPTDVVHFWRLDGSAYLPDKRTGVTLGYFNSTGTTDATLYAPGAVYGSATGQPNSSGVIAELDFNPWLNTRFMLQYTAYNKFNGAGSNYDGFGRSASANNTLYLNAWLVF